MMVELSSSVEEIPPPKIENLSGPQGTETEKEDLGKTSGTNSRTGNMVVL
jgi:hypothetical protein